MKFWKESKNGKINIDDYGFKLFLEKHLMFKHYIYNSETDDFVFVRKEDNFIDIIKVSDIKDYIVNYIENNDSLEVFNSLMGNLKYFRKDYLSMIKTTEINIAKDTEYHALIYYKNKAARITKDKIDLIDYDDINGYVWRSSVVDRDIVLQDESSGIFKRFIWLLAGENKERYYTLKSVLGYLLHTYKDPVRNKAIIFNDELISDKPNGGSGKGLLHDAINQIKGVSNINGKDYDNDNKFKFQNVKPDSQVVLFDDVKRNFNFENLFSIITEDFVIERKNQKPVVLNFSDSPKISISTNYTIKGDGGSFKRRVFEVEISSYFNDKHTPFDEFKSMLFKSWDDKEWQLFDNYMLRCIKYYLDKGLVDSEFVNLPLRKLITATSKEFIEFMESDTYIKGTKYYKTELKDMFIAEYSDYAKRWFSSRLFNNWLIVYCEYKGFVLTKSNDSTGRYVIITTKDGVIPTEDSLPF